MRAIALVLAFAGSMGAVAQAPTPAPSIPSNPSQLFQTPPDQRAPHFQFHQPDLQQRFTLPRTFVVKPAPDLPRREADPGIVHRPQGFAQHPGKPLLQDLYPGLTLMPIEEARMDAPPVPGSSPKALPIPRAFPKARLKPIPTKWDSFRLVPIDKGETAGNIPK